MIQHSINLLPRYATRHCFNKKLFSAYILLHCSLFLTPLTYSTSGLILFMALSFITGCLGITLCYHRLLAHRSYKTYRWVQYILSFFAVLAFQRGPIWWVAAHRLHHKHVDQALDPHAPSVNFIWSHFLWAFFTHPQLDESIETVHRLALDIAEDPGMQFLEKYYTAINTGFLGLLFGAGYWIGGIQLGLSYLIWGGFLRMVFILNVTWLVNSATHLWGYQSYQTKDSSRNNWWVALLTFGEGWHNNHHADQRAARNGHRWYEVDVTYYIILLMRQIKLATHVVPVSKRLKRRIPHLSV